MARPFIPWLICGVSAVLMGLVGPAGVRAEATNRIVAIVSDDVITLHELNKRIKEITGMEPEEILARDPQMHENLRRTVLERLIEERISMEKTRELGIEVKDSEVKQAIERGKENNHLTDDELMETLKQNGMTYDEYRQKVKEELQRQKLINFEVKSRVLIREEEIEAYYDEHKEDFRREGGIDLATIFLLRNNPNRPAQDLSVEQRAEHILAALKNGESFGQLAKQYSDGPGAEEGGYLGRFDPGELEPELRHIVEETPEGGVSDLIIRPNGIQIIRVLSKFGGGLLPLEKARDAIYGILFREEIDRRYTAWIKDLKEKTYTKIFF